MLDLYHVLRASSLDRACKYDILATVLARRGKRYGEPKTVEHLRDRSLYVSPFELVEGARVLGDQPRELAANHAEDFPNFSTKTLPVQFKPVDPGTKTV